MQRGVHLMTPYCNCKRGRGHRASYHWPTEHLPTQQEQTRTMRFGGRSIERPPKRSWRNAKNQDGITIYHLSLPGAQKTLVISSTSKRGKEQRCSPRNSQAPSSGDVSSPMRAQGMPAAA